MSMRLEGKSVVITGAASGIGRAMARRFAAEGARLLIADIDKERLGKVKGQLAETGAQVLDMVIDVGDKEQVEAMVQSAADTFGSLDVLCNNAGVLDNLTPLEDVEDEMWDRVMSINVRGPFLAARKALPIMVEQGGGSIINTASAAGLAGGRGGAVYTASKHAVVGLTSSIAWFYGPKGVRCNAIAPGAIQTKMAASLVPHMGGFERYQPYFSQIPPHGKASEVADVALFLASSDSAYVNGAVIPVDGGWLTF